MAEIVYPGVTTGLNKPGRKMTKGLFQQVVLEEVWSVMEDEDGNIVFKDDDKESPVWGVQGVVVGWVNYYWRGCDGSNYHRLSNGGWNEQPLPPKPSLEDAIHILWRKKTKTGEEYRRCLMTRHDDGFDVVTKGIQQLFLGEFCF